MRSLSSTFLLLLIPTAALAQRSPYVAYEGRPIKALSPERVGGLLNGDGLESALPAELNGYPGPRHVLELGDSLALTPAQREATERLYQALRAQAIGLGERIVAREAQLDSLFASRGITAPRLRELLDELGGLEAALRGTHLEAHLVMVDLLTEAQVRRYHTLRGYGHGAHGH